MLLGGSEAARGPVPPHSLGPRRPYICRAVLWPELAADDRQGATDGNSDGLGVSPGGWAARASSGFQGPGFHLLSWGRAAGHQGERGVQGRESWKGVRAGQGVREQAEAPFPWGGGQQRAMGSPG